MLIPYSNRKILSRDVVCSFGKGEANGSRKLEKAARLFIHNFNEF